MIRTLKSEEGITLIELMASLAILSIVILLVGSVHIFGQTQFINQTERASQSNDLRYSLSLVSRDVRQAGLVVKDHENETYTIGPTRILSKNLTYLEIMNLLHRRVNNGHIFHSGFLFIWLDLRLVFQRGGPSCSYEIPFQ